MAEISRVAQQILPPGDKAIVLYDGECNLCKTISATLLDWDRGRTLMVTPIQSLAGDRLLGDLPDDVRLSSFHFVDRDGTRYSGGPALAPMFANLPGGHPLARALRAAPGPVDGVYEFVATNRQKLSRYIPERLKRRSRSRLEKVLAESRDELERITANAERKEETAPERERAGTSA
jgi:predicted DCC family thiol-disulfide oxidoreductase YuxK